MGYDPLDIERRAVLDELSRNGGWPNLISSEMLEKLPIGYEIAGASRGGLGPLVVMGRAGHKYLERR